MYGMTGVPQDPSFLSFCGLYELDHDHTLNRNATLTDEWIALA